MLKRHYTFQSTNNIDKDETDANSEITILISHITTLTLRRDPLIKSILSPKLLIRGLTELKSMIEMVDIKKSIVNQIKFLITNHARKSTTDNIRSKSAGFEGHMLHSVISGNPGTGKTSVGMILAKIWMSLGFVKRNAEDKQTESNPNVKINSIINESYRQRISELEESQYNNHRKFIRIKELLGQYYETTGELRHQMIKLRQEPEDIMNKCDSLLGLSRDLRFGLDEIIREVNVEDPNMAYDCGLIELATSATLSTPDEIDPYEDVDPKFVVAAREDLIAEYLGQTAPKTKKVLESARGGVLFIDEAYSLCNMDGGSKDRYGEECLTTINEFMSLHPDEIIIIFAGYTKLLFSSIFRAQPGLLRRCAQFFEIKDYTNKGLAKIFTRQLNKNNWELDPDVDIEQIFEENTDIIRDNGGFTDKLALQSKIAYGASKFSETVHSSNENAIAHNGIITNNMIKMAIEQIRMQIDDRMILDHPPTSMYI